MGWTSLIFKLLCALLLGACGGTLPHRPSPPPPPAPPKAPTPPGPTTSSQAWFVERSQSYGLTGPGGERFYVVDFNHDGHEDLILLESEYGGPRFLAFHPPTGTFRPLSYSPFSSSPRFYFLMVTDLDRDGVRDLIGVHSRHSFLPEKSGVEIYRGKLHQGRISYQREFHFLQNLPISSLGLVDVNLDGFLDLFVANQYQSLEGQQVPLADLLFLGKGFEFSPLPQALQGEEERINHTPTVGVSSCDVNLDGRVDLLTVNGDFYANKYWVHQGLREGRPYFRNFAQESGYAADEAGRGLLKGGGDSTFSACTDYNQTGIMDLFVAERSRLVDGPQVDRSSILTGMHRRFPTTYTRTPYSLSSGGELRDHGDQRAIWEDFNADGQVDLWVDNSDFPPHSRALLFIQQEDHAFEEQGARAGIDLINPKGTVLLDVNGDARWDLLTGQGNERDQRIAPRKYLFEQRPRPRQAFLKVRYRPRRAHPDAPYLIKLITSQGVQTRWKELWQGSRPSQHSRQLFFPLPGPTTRGARLEVHFPIAHGPGERALVKVYPLPPLQGSAVVQVDEAGLRLVKGGPNALCPAKTCP